MVGPFRFKPGCCGCDGEDCVFYTDPFDGEGFGDVDTDFWEDISDAFILDNELVFVSGSGYMKSITEQPDGDAAVIVSVQMKSPDVGAIGRVLVNVIDSNNYLYGELYFNGVASEVRIGKRVSGTDTQLNQHYVSLAADTFYTLKVYWDGEETHNLVATGATHTIRAVVDDGGMGSMTRTPAFGLACMSDSVYIDNLVAETHKLSGNSCPSIAPTCLIDSHQFENTSDIEDENLETISGTWSVASGKLTTASTSALAILKTRHPRRVSSQALYVSFSGDEDDEIDVIIGYKDGSSSYYMARFVIGGCVYLYEGGGGLTLLAVMYLSLADATSIDAVLYLGDGTFTVTVGSLKAAVAATTDAADFDYVGVGTGDQADNVEFSSIAYYRLKTEEPDEEDCPEAPTPPSNCLILYDFYDDTFSYAGTLISPCNWTIDSGTWLIEYATALRQLKCTDTGVIECNAVLPDLVDEGVLQVHVRMPTANDEVKLHIGSNSCTIRRVNSTTWKINGTDYVLGIGSSSGLVVRFCALGGLRSVNVQVTTPEEDPTSWIAAAQVAASNSGTGVAKLEVSNNVSGGVYFSEFKLFDNELENCPKCIAGCSFCTDNTYMVAVAAEVSGVVNNVYVGIPACNMTCCDDFNGVKIFDRRAGGCTPPRFSGGCLYRYTYPGPPYCQAHTFSPGYPFYWLDLCIGVLRDTLLTRHLHTSGTFGFAAWNYPAEDGSTWDQLCEDLGDIVAGDWVLYAGGQAGTVASGGCGYCNFTAGKLINMVPIFSLGSSD